MLSDTDNALGIKPVKLGKDVGLRYIPFSQLAIPWNILPNPAALRRETRGAKQTDFSTFRRTNPKNSKAERIWKNGDLEALKRSIAQYGLLKPFEVAEMQGKLDFFYGDGKYFVIDGQRRYFAIRMLLKLPSEEEERRRRESLRTDSSHSHIVNAEMQAQRQFDKLSVADYVLVPCLVYPYTTLLQMIRHSLEDKRFSEQPSKEDFELVDKMSAQGINDLRPDDLGELWKTHPRIEMERQSIEKTLEEIRGNLEKNRPRIKLES